MKNSLNKKTKISKDSKESVQECLTEFISFVTCEASDKCQKDKRKTINGDDILYSLKLLGFDKYHEILEIYLEKYRKAWSQEDKNDGLEFFNDKDKSEIKIRPRNQLDR